MHPKNKITTELASRYAKKFVLVFLLSFVSLISITVFLFSHKAKAASTTYYIDNCVVTGNDSNNGTSSSTPWLTVNKVTDSVFNPGDSILFRSGCEWREQLGVYSSGTSGNPITFGAYGTGAAPIISGSNVISGWVAAPTSTTVYASGTVSQANMRLSTASGTSFVDFSASGALTPYVGDAITITDHSANQITGYIKATSTGQTYGSQLLANTSLNTTSSIITPYNSTVSSVAGGYPSGNALQVNITSTSGNADELLSSVATGTLLQATSYVKNGTISSYIGFEIAEWGGSYNSLDTVYTSLSTSTWLQYTTYATADMASMQILWAGGGTSGQYLLANDASVEQVLTPSITGVKIVSTSGGSTYNWGSVASGFNLDDSSGYTYSISSSISYPNVWSSSVATQPQIVLFNGVVGTPVSGESSVVASGDWYWNANVLYIYSVGSPTGIEASARTDAIVAINESYLNITGLNLEGASGGVIYESGGSHINVYGNTMFGSGSVCVGMNGPANNINVYQNTISYCDDDGIGLSTSITASNIYQNNVSHSGLTIDDRSGIAIFGATSTPSYGNSIYQNSTHDNTDGKTTGIRGILIDTVGSQTNYVYQNKAWNNDGGGIGVFLSQNQEVYDNLSWGSNTSLSQEGEFYSGDNASSTDNNFFYNNSALDYDATACFLTENSGGNIFKNNLCIVTNASPGFLTEDGDATTQTWDHNLVYSTTSPDLYSWNGAGYSSASAFYLATAQGQHDINTNPKVLSISTSSPNFALSSSSPAIDAGLNLGSSYDLGLDPLSTWPGGVTLDNENNYGSGWDLGAYVFTQQILSNATSSGTTATSTTITWTSNSSSTSEVDYGTSTSYGSSTTSGTLTSSHSIQLLNLTPNTTYHYIASSTDASGNSGTSTDQTFMTGATTTSTPPQSVSATAGNGNATISFSAPSSNGGSSITLYTITSSPGSFTATTTTATPVTISGLTNGTSYTFTVTATNAIGNSSPASSNSVTPVAPVTNTVTVEVAAGGGGGSGYGAPVVTTMPTSTTPTATTTPSITSSSSLSTTPSLQSELQSLESELASLESQAGSTGSSPSSPTTPSSYLFTRNLSYGMTGSDVRELQEFLIQEASGPAAAKLQSHGTTENFGILTYNALVEFQKAQNIIPASGFFGPITRGWVEGH